MAEILTCLVAGYLTDHVTIRRCLSWCARHLKWLRKMGLSLRNGIASVATVSRILAGIDDELFLFAFMEWIGEILGARNLDLACQAGAQGLVFDKDGNVNITGQPYVDALK